MSTKDSADHSHSVWGYNATQTLSALGAPRATLYDFQGIIWYWDWIWVEHMSSMYPNY